MNGELGVLGYILGLEAKLIWGPRTTTLVSNKKKKSIL